MGRKKPRGKKKGISSSGIRYYKYSSMINHDLASGSVVVPINSNNLPGRQKNRPTSIARVRVTLSTQYDSRAFLGRLTIFHPTGEAALVTNQKLIVPTTRTVFSASPRMRAGTFDDTDTLAIFSSLAADGGNAPKGVIEFTILFEFWLREGPEGDS